jgi:hypothetical protein
MILITTAGKVGSEAARRLAQRGEPVRIVVRSAEKVTVRAQAGAEVFECDLDVPGAGHVGHIDVRDVAAVVTEISASPSVGVQILGALPEAWTSPPAFGCSHAARAVRDGQPWRPRQGCVAGGRKPGPWATPWATLRLWPSSAPGFSRSHQHKSPAKAMLLVMGTAGFEPATSRV